MRRSPYDELLARIREMQGRPLHISELEPGVVYGPPGTLKDDVRFAFAVVCIDEIVVGR